MNRISKASSLLLTIIIALSCLTFLTVKPASAQSIPTPSAPAFTLTLEGPSLQHNTTYQLDPNTGQVVADLGFTNQYTSVVLTIKNQPFDSANGKLYYGIQVKNQNTGNQWQNVTYDGPYPEQSSDSNTTILRLNIQGQWSLPSIAGYKTDIRVQALLGNFYYGHVHILGGWMFSGQVSDWSNPQTINIPANVPLASTPNPSPTLTPTPTSTAITTPSNTPSDSLSDNQQLTNIAFIITVAVLGGVIVSLLVYVRRIKSSVNQPAK